MYNVVQTISLFWDFNYIIYNLRGLGPSKQYIFLGI